MIKVLIFDATWLENIYSGIRLSFLDTASIAVTVAVELAAIFCVIKLIQLAAKIMSDNQMGGYGGIDILEIIRPLVLFFIIQAFPIVVGPLDTLCNSVSTALSFDAAKVTYNNSAALNRIRESNLKLIQIQDGQNGNTFNSGNYGNEIRQGASGGVSTDPAMDMGKSLQENLANEKVRQKKATWLEKTWSTLTTNPITGLVNWISNMILGYDLFDSNGTGIFGVLFSGIMAIVNWIVTLLFDLEKIIMYAMSNFYLSFLVFLGPLAFAFSILDNWSKAYLTWIATYIEVSLWKVGIAVISKCTQLAAVSIYDSIKATSFPTLDGAIAQLLVGKETIELFFTMIAFICGYKCLKKVPQLVHMGIAISSEAGSGDAGGGGVAAAAGKAANTATDIGTRFIAPH